MLWLIPPLSHPPPSLVVRVESSGGETFADGTGHLGHGVGNTEDGLFGEGCCALFSHR